MYALSVNSSTVASIIQLCILSTTVCQERTSHDTKMNNQMQHRNEFGSDNFTVIMGILVLNDV